MSGVLHDVSQEDVYNTVAHNVVLGALEGYNGQCIFNGCHLNTESSLRVSWFGFTQISKRTHYDVMVMVIVFSRRFYQQTFGQKTKNKKQKQTKRQLLK